MWVLPQSRRVGGRPSSPARFPKPQPHISTAPHHHTTSPDHITTASPLHHHGTASPLDGSPRADRSPPRRDRFTRANNCRLRAAAPVSSPLATEFAAAHRHSPAKFAETTEATDGCRRYDIIPQALVDGGGLYRLWRPPGAPGSPAPTRCFRHDDRAAPIAAHPRRSRRASGRSWRASGVAGAVAARHAELI